VLIFVYDLKNSLIPDRFIYPAIIISLIYQLFSGGQTFLNLLLAILIGSGLFFFIFLISRGKWIGFGDVTLGLFMGLFLGFPNIIVALFLGVFLGAIIGLGLMFYKKKKLSSEIPFGPFLITGTVISFLFGKQIINWYLNFLI
jgi:prepilin signal peptidase PulO-like enzyme (type II secretory pathway)